MQVNTDISSCNPVSTPTNTYYIYGFYNDSNNLAIESLFSGEIRFKTAAQSTSSVPTTGTTRMTILPGGNVIINGEGSGGQGTLTVRKDAGIPVSIANEAASGTLIRFSGNGSGVLGSISHNGTNVAYNTSSDYRLKEDLKDFDGLDIISKIKFYDFAWKTDNSRMIGVIAHELEQILPYAVFGKKDAEEMQAVDYSKLVAIQGKAIQQLEERIKQLEA